MFNNDMIFVLDKDYDLNINYKNEKVNLPWSIKEKIQKNWEENGEKFTNGDIFYINRYDINENDKMIKMDICNSTYDHYLYTRLKKEYDEYSCVNLWSGAVLETADKKLVLGRMSFQTVCEGELHISGGSTDKKDLNGKTIDCKKTMVRELYEEMGIDINDKNVVKDYFIKYLKLPSIKEVELSFGILYKINLNITFEELESNFNKYIKYLKDNVLEVEFTKIYGIDKTKKGIEEAKEKYGNRIPAYTIELFLKECEEN